MPTVADRVAQMVVKQVIEPDLDAVFLTNSYGYRPRKSALDAVGVKRERCWKYDWVLEFDIKGLFDNIDHTLLLRAVRKHVAYKWALLCIERCAHSGDCDRPFQPKVITDSGDRDHVLTRPSESA